MGNILKDLSDGDITREILAEFHNASTFLKTINNQYDNRFAISGAKNDGTILIRKPNEFVVRTGKTMNIQDVSEQTLTLQVATQKGVDMPSFSSLEHTMQVDDFRKKYARPAMLRLAAEVESDIITNLYKTVFNQTGTPATDLNTLLAVRNAGARLSENLAPRGDRTMLMNAAAMAATANTMNAFFHKGSELEKQFTDGFIGHAVGFDWMESEMIPNHTNGTRDDTTPVTDTSAGTFVNGATTLVTTGFDNADTVKKGDIFTIGTTTNGLMSINRETKARLSHLQQFTVRTDKTLDSTDTLDISPTIELSGPRQNMELVGTAGSMALINTTAGGSGAGSLITPQHLAYHRDAFTFATVDLHKEPGERMSVESIDNISMRVWHGADIKNDEFVMRIDILYGFLALRPEWANRTRG